MDTPHTDDRESPVGEGREKSEDGQIVRLITSYFGTSKTSKSGWLEYNTSSEFSPNFLQGIVGRYGLRGLVSHIKTFCSTYYSYQIKGNCSLTAILERIVTHA